VAASTLFASETGAALSLLERANDLEADFLTPDRTKSLELLVASAVQQATILQLAWFRCTQEGDVWETRMYLQRVRTIDFLTQVVADILVKAQEIVARLRKSHPEWAPPSTVADVDTYSQAVKDIGASVRKTLEWLQRPRPPVNEEMVRRSRESLARGEGEEIREIIARVESGGSLIRE
jgi:hypothetical protein